MSKQAEDISFRAPDVSKLALTSVLNAKNFFGNTQENNPNEFSEGLKLRLHLKVNDEYKRIHSKAQTPIEKKDSVEIPQPEPDYTKDIENIAMNIHAQPSTKPKTEPGKQKAGSGPESKQKIVSEVEISSESAEIAVKSDIEKMIEEVPKDQAEKLSKIPKKFLIFNKKEAPIEEEKSSTALQTVQFQGGQLAPIEGPRMGTITLAKLRKIVKPTWHAPWKLMRVISGNEGWVRCMAVDHSNKFFVTGSTDRTIKFWDMATGKRILTLVGHINAVRGLALSSRHAYLYSCGEDKKIFCWDLETNKIVRNYHGHLSGIYSMSLHPSLDILATGGRDAVVRLWDCRTKAQIHVLEGHKHAVSSLASQDFEPQLISGSHDNMVKLWDIGMGKAVATLTNHKKAIRSLAVHHSEYTFASGAADNIKVWKCPDGEFMRNISGHNAIINSLSLNQDNVLVSCGDNGAMHFWDWPSGYNFQQLQSKPQPGSISAEGGIFCSAFDRSSMRLITGECDKTIKMWKEDEEATEETHPIDLNWRPHFQLKRVIVQINFKNIFQI